MYKAVSLHLFTLQLQSSVEKMQGWDICIFTFTFFTSLKKKSSYVDLIGTKAILFWSPFYYGQQLGYGGDRAYANFGCVFIVEYTGVGCICY